MLVCGNCNIPQLNGALFCAECGASLDLVFAASPPARPVAGRSSLSAVVLVSRRRVGLPVDEGEPLLIGRRDESRGIVPALDLAPDGGFDAGVSRRHAAIHCRGGVYQVEDLGSANGTYLNGRRLAPHVPAALANGDELRCGELRLRIEIQ